MKARLAFDIKITQLMIVKLALEGMDIGFFENDEEDLSQFGYSMSLAVMMLLGRVFKISMFMRPTLISISRAVR